NRRNVAAHRKAEVAALEHRPSHGAWRPAGEVDPDLAHGGNDGRMQRGGGLRAPGDRDVIRGEALEERVRHLAASGVLPAKEQDGHTPTIREPIRRPPAPPLLPRRRPTSPPSA